MARQGDNIYKRKDGRYEGRYMIGHKPNRTPKYGYIYGISYSEVKKKLISIKVMYERPRNGTWFRGSFSEYLLRWLEITSAEKNIKASTYGGYYRIIHNHIIPSLGSKFPHMLTKSDIQSFGRGLTNKGLSQGTAANVLRLLFSVIKSAMEEDIIEKDICKGVRIPRTRKNKIPVLTRTSQYILEKTCEHEKNGIEVLLALYTGMRVGEICALKWSDIDLNEGLVYVHKTVQRITRYRENSAGSNGDAKTLLNFESPKTESSERVIALSPNMITYLSKCRLSAVGEYVVSCKGGVAEPRVCQYRFEKLLKKAGIKRVNFHVLRHTYATRCMEEGMDLKTLSQLMGHSQMSMTLKYGDSLTEHKKLAVKALDNVYKTAV